MKQINHSEIERLRELAGKSVLLTGVEPGPEVYSEFKALLRKCRDEGLDLGDMSFFDSEDDDCPLCLDLELQHVYYQLTPGCEDLSGVGYFDEGEYEGEER